MVCPQIWLQIYLGGRVPEKSRTFALNV